MEPPASDGASLAREKKHEIRTDISSLMFLLSSLEGRGSPEISGRTEAMAREQPPVQIGLKGILVPREVLPATSEHGARAGLESPRPKTSRFPWFDPVERE